MITVQDALDAILAKAKNYGTETLSLENASGRILAQDIATDRDYPPFDRVTMDGIAIDFSKYKSGQRTFVVEGVAAAGSPFLRLSSKDNCLEVMTGAGMPDGCDTVIRYEDLELDEGKKTASIIAEAVVNEAQNVHFQGSDKKSGTVILKEGVRIRASEIGIAASLCCSTLVVRRVTKTAIISTGDELVSIEETPLPHQIRKSNVFSIQARLRDYGIASSLYHLVDNKESIRTKIKELLDTYEILILSGGVSKGKFDFIPEILNELGVVKSFHKIKQRPGKPFWFGSTAENVIFALPGNPVSSFVCTKKYVESWLCASLGIARPIVYGVLSEAVEFKPDLHYFLEVDISYLEDGSILAHPKKGNGSGDFVNLTRAQALIELPRGKNVFEKGEVYPLIFFER